MPVFISYSHEDAEFAHKLAANLVRKNAHVWIDEWELNVGDSIIARVQDAIQDSSALLILLSKASVQSEWCKKELNVGLIRELDEKRVLVLPVLLEDCEIPLFLRDKLYADFRRNFDVGLTKLADALLKVTSQEQARISSGTGHIDWSEDYGYLDDGSFGMTFTLVEFWDSFPFSILTQISVYMNDVVNRNYKRYRDAGLGWLGRLAIVDEIAVLADSADLKVLLEDAKAKTVKHFLEDKKTKAEYGIIITSRRMGQDNGKDQLINVGNYLRQIRDYVKQGARKPTPEELSRLEKL